MRILKPTVYVECLLPQAHVLAGAGLVLGPFSQCWKCPYFRHIPESNEGLYRCAYGDEEAEGGEKGAP